MEVHVAQRAREFRERRLRVPARLTSAVVCLIIRTLQSPAQLLTDVSMSLIDLFC